MKGPALIVASLVVALSFSASAEAGFLKNLKKVAKASRETNAIFLRAAPKAAKEGNLRILAETSKRANKLFLNCAINPNYDDPESSMTCPK